MKFPDMLRQWFTDAEHFIHNEEQEVDQMITDALNNLAAAITAVVNERATDKAAVAQAQSDLAQATSDRDAAQAEVATLQGQLSDAEAQVNNLTAQLAPPAQ